MRFNRHKLYWVAIWIAVVFTYVWLLSYYYENDKGYASFVLLAIAGNLAYDGLKALLFYDARDGEASRAITGYVVGFLAALAASVTSLFVAAQLVVYGIASDRVGQSIAGVGFLSSIAAGMWLLANAERTFKRTNTTSVAN